MSTCVICGRRCIPMADYDPPVCPRCDERAAAVLEVGPWPLSPAVPPLRDLFDRVRAEIGAA